MKRKNHIGKILIILLMTLMIASNFGSAIHEESEKIAWDNMPYKPVDRNNNVQDDITTSNKGIDLCIRSISIDPEYVIAPTDVDVNVLVENCGTVHFPWTFMIGVSVYGAGNYGVVFIAGEIPQPGEVILAQAHIPVNSPGIYYVKIEIDPFLEIPEINENNNEGKIYFIAY